MSSFVSNRKPLEVDLVKWDVCNLPLRSHSVDVFITDLVRNCFVYQNHELTHYVQGYRLTFFHQEQAGPLKQNDFGPSPKLRDPGFGRKLLISTPLLLLCFFHN